MTNGDPMCRICLSLFLASLEVSIVDTSLVVISADLENFSEISWVIAAYLLTYSGLSFNLPASLVWASDSVVRIPGHLGQME